MRLDRGPAARRPAGRARARPTTWPGRWPTWSPTRSGTPGRAGRYGWRPSRADDGQIQVAVIDGCGGMPGGQSDRVFDAGWRGTPSRAATTAAPDSAWRSPAAWSSPTPARSSFATSTAAAASRSTLPASRRDGVPATAPERRLRFRTYTWHLSRPIKPSRAGVRFPGRQSETAPVGAAASQGIRTSFPRTWPPWLIWCASAARSEREGLHLDHQLALLQQLGRLGQRLHRLAVRAAAGHPRASLAAPKLAIETTCAAPGPAR